MSQRLKPLLVLLVASALALLWAAPASGLPTDTTPSSSPESSSSDAGDEAGDDTGGGLLDEVLPTPTTVPPSPTEGDDDTTVPESTATETEETEPTTPEPIDRSEAPPAGPAEARVAAALADPVAAALPSGFTPDDLRLALEGLGFDPSDEQLAALFELLQGPEQEDPLAEFCSNFGVPVFCEGVELPDGQEPTFTCDEFAVLFGFDDCESIPLCIPVPSPPPGLPLPPPPSPPFCESPSTPTPTPTPTPKPNQPGYYQPGQQHTGYQYRNCDEARAAGAAPVYSGQYGYGSHLDADYDGVGCEESYGHYATTHPVAQHVAYDQAGKLAYTGVTVQPLLIWGAALLLSGGWLIRSSRRSA